VFIDFLRYAACEDIPIILPQPADFILPVMKIDLNRYFEKASGDFFAF